MSIREIAQYLIDNCTFKHANGKPYKDDALDTWSFLFATDYSYTFEEVEKQMTEITGIIYD